MLDDIDQVTHTVGFAVTLVQRWVATLLGILVTLAPSADYCVEWLMALFRPTLAGSEQGRPSRTKWGNSGASGVKNVNYLESDLGLLRKLAKTTPLAPLID